MELNATQEYHTFRRALRDPDRSTRYGGQILSRMDFQMFCDLAEPMSQWGRVDMVFQLCVMLCPVVGIWYGRQSVDITQPADSWVALPYDRIPPEL